MLMLQETAGLMAVRSYPPEVMEMWITDVLGRATARAALACAHGRGRNNPHFADRLAVEAMRAELDTLLPVGAEVVIGEGERDEAPMLHIRERLGPNRDDPPQLLIAVDPLEGTNLCAHWVPGSICVIAAALVGEGSLWRGVDGYMDRLVLGRRIAERLADLRSGRGTSEFAMRFSPDRNLLDQPIEDVISLISFFTGKPITSIVAEVLDRPRNQELINRLRHMHVQVRLITDGDVASAWRALSGDHDVDLYRGIGAAPEGVISAAMTNVLGGYMEGRCWFDGTSKGDKQRQRLLNQGVDVEKLNTVEDLAGGHVMMAFTAVTDSMVPGVCYEEGGVAITHTIKGRSRSRTFYAQKGYHRDPPAPPSRWPLNGEK